MIPRYQALKHLFTRPAALVATGSRRQLLPVLGMGFVLISLAEPFVRPEADCQSRFLGAWEYRQRAGDGYDKEGERLELSCTGGSMRGLYFGLEREGEHGLFYTLAEVIDLKLNSNGDLTFTVPERDLYHERLKNLQDIKQKRLASAGFTRDQLHLKGQLKEGNLILTCISKGRTCPEDVMVFFKAN
jgi:hypothetical protein